MYTPYIMDTAILCVIALFAVRLQIIVNPPQKNVPTWDTVNRTDDASEVVTLCS